MNKDPLEREDFHLIMKDFLKNKKFIAFQLFPGQFHTLRDFGSQLLGSIVVSPYFRGLRPEKIKSDGVPTLMLPSLTKNIFTLVVDAFSPSIEQYLEEVIDFINEVDSEKECTSIISYLPITKKLIDKTQRSTHIQAAETARYLENKSNFYTIAGQFNIPHIKGKEVTWPQPRSWWDEMCTEFSTEKTVIQLLGLFGGGRNTFLVSSYDEAHDCLSSFSVKEGQPLRFSPYLGDESYNGLVNIIPTITDDECYVMAFPISRQHTLLDSQKRILYFGNYLDSFFSKEEEREIVSKMKYFGHRIYEEFKFSGPLGIDFLYHPKKGFLLLDINSRINGVFSSLSQCFDYRYKSSLLGLVFCRYNNIEKIQRLEELFDREIKETPASRRYITFEAARDFKVNGELKKGIYRLDVKDNGFPLKFSREADTYLKIRDPDNEIFYFPMLSNFYEKDHIVMIGEAFLQKPLEEKLAQLHGKKVNTYLLDTFLKLAEIKEDCFTSSAMIT